MDRDPGDRRRPLADPDRAARGVRAVRLGREGDLLLGRAVTDTGISRRSVVVTAMPEGWQLETAEP